jgi:hypothetical protein
MQVIYQLYISPQDPLQMDHQLPDKQSVAYGPPNLRSELLLPALQTHFEV